MELERNHEGFEEKNKNWTTNRWNFSQRKTSKFLFFFQICFN